MAQSPINKVEYMADGDDAGFLFLANETNRGEHTPINNVREIGTTDPADLSPGPVDGDAVIVGTGAGGTDFDGHDGEYAMYYAGWLFRPVREGDIVYDQQTGSHQRYTGTTWAPLFLPIDATERWTGLVGPTGAPIYKKWINLGALPNTTTANVAHGITSLPVGKGKYFNIVATASTGSVARPIPYNDGTNRIDVSVNATNIVVTTNFNASGSDGVCLLEYEK